MPPLLRRALALVLAACAVGGGSASATSRVDDPLPEFAPNRVLVGFADGVAPEARQAAVARARGREVAKIGADTHLVEVAPGSVLETVDRLNREPVVRYAEPDWMLMADQVPNDPLFGNQWALQNTGQTIVNGSTSFTGTAGADIKATAAWDYTVGAAWDPVTNPTAPVVGIVDTGLAYQHQDLAENSWANPLPFDFAYTYVDANGVTQTHTTCPVGSHGWDARRHVCDPYDPADVPTHGTRVAGIIGARGNNAVGVAGLNWTVRMMGLRWNDDDCLCGFTSQAIEAIDFAVQAKQAWTSSGGTQGTNVRVLSASWGCCYPNTSRRLPYDPALLDEVRKAGLADILFVASAGNLSRSIDPPNYANLHYPCGFDNAKTFGTYDPPTATFTPDQAEQIRGPATNVICVASTNYYDQLSTFSNWGPDTVQIAAPGSAIESTLPGNQYMFGSGTSFATPYVSGAAALVLAQRPTLSVLALKHVLVGSYEQEFAPMTGCQCAYEGGASVDQLASLSGRLSTGGGRLNVCRAIEGCAPVPTGVSLRSFSASRHANAVVLDWRSATERDTLGFNLFRHARGTSVRLNQTLIRSAFGGTTRGYRYRYTWTDRLGRGRPAEYRLQSVGLSGRRTWLASTVVR